jgi:hypothetical protein
VVGQLIETGGKISFEQIVLQNGMLSAPLQYGAVKARSENISLGGRLLIRDKDYSIDYAAGTIYLRVPFKPGDSLRVTYRYDPAKGAKGTFGVGGDQSSVNGYTFTFAPGTKAIVGLGLTERVGDGSVISSNVFGLNNSFGFMGGKLSGLLMIDNRTKSENRNLFTGAVGKAKVDEGQGSAILQNFASSFMGGSISGYYQSIDQKFAGFRSFTNAGYTNAQVAQLRRERGLKRTGFNFEGLQVGAANFSSKVDTIGDDAGAITERSLGGQIGGFNFNWSSAEVDQGFKRFKDVDPKNWKQLQKEKGLDRQSLVAGLGFSGGKLSFSQNSVNSNAGSIQRRAIGIDSKIAKISYTDQGMDDGFSRFNDLRSQDGWNGKQLRKEAGLSRRAFSLSSDAISGTGLNFNSSTISSDDGSFGSIDASVKSGDLSIQHSSRNVDEGFDRLSHIGGEAGSHVNSIISMYGEGLKAHKSDMGGFFGSSGLDRSLWKLGYDLNGAKFGYQVLKIDAEESGLEKSSYSLTAKNYGINYSDQGSDSGFNEIRNLMHTERLQVGTLPGLSKQNFSAWTNLGSGKKLAFDFMDADGVTGGASRQSIDYKGSGLDINLARRSVDDTFIDVGQMVDPEKRLLQTLIGKDMTEGRVKWSLAPNMKIDSRMFSIKDFDGGFGELFQSKLLWSPDGKTNIEALTFSHQEGEFDDPSIDQAHDVLKLSRNFGQFGKVTLTNDRKEFDGSEETRPDSDTKSVVYETNLSSTTGIRSEKSDTSYEDGKSERTMAHTISTAVSKRAGVSLTNIQVTGDARADENKREYGFWMDFGGGVKLSYGLNRKLKEDSNGTLQSKATLTGGTVQDVKFDTVSYQHDRWDNSRDRHLGKLSLASARPLDWGFIQNVQFNFTADTNRDKYLWRREIQNYGMSGTKGDFGFGFVYHSQVAPSGERAIDRTFTLATDKDNKDPVRATLKYGVRTMPDDKDYAIRDYTLLYQPNKEFNLKHTVSTNALKAQKNVLLGTIATPLRTNLWQLDYVGNKKTKSGLFWREDLNDHNKFLKREAGVKITLFADNPSPLNLTYGLAQTDSFGNRRTMHRFSLNFTQRPGPNQSLSFGLSNLNWEHGRPDKYQVNNWNLRLDYSVRF